MIEITRFDAQKLSFNALEVLKQRYLLKGVFTGIFRLPLAETIGFSLMFSAFVKYQSAELK